MVVDDGTCEHYFYSEPGGCMGSIEFNGSIEYPDRNLLKKRYDAQYPALEQEREGLEKRLRMLLQAESIGGTVKGRIKSFESYYAKLLRRLSSPGHDRAAGEATEEVIKDLLGIRILTPFLDSVSDIEKLVRSNFPVFEVERKGEEQSFREFGYRSVHLNLRLGSGNFCEIQIRTILQDAWAEVEHEIVYKGSFTPFDEPLKRKLAALNATLSLSDIIFQEIRDYQRKLNLEVQLRRDTFRNQVRSASQDTGAEKRESNVQACGDSSDSSEETDKSTDQDQLLLKALQIHNRGGYREAIDLYSSILTGSLPPDIRSLTLVHRGMARFAYADYKGAEKDFLEAVEFGGSEEKPYSYLGMLYRATGVPRKALDAFTRVLSSDPYHIESLIGAAQALFDLGDAAASVEYCDRAMKLNPDMPQLRHLRNRAVRRLGF